MSARTTFGVRGLTLIAGLALSLPGSAAAQQTATKHPGTSPRCNDFAVVMDLLLFDIPLQERPDEGWAWVEPHGRKLRSATGDVANVRVASNDTPANHDSHDLDFNLVLDPNQEDLLSFIQSHSIGIEWETGMDALVDQKGEGKRTFPKWIWPSAGDRAWVEGHWILDCGHPDKSYDPWVFRSEIHPPRAVAVMRDQAAPLPGTGTTPVPVTLTDVFISGRGGYAVQILNCGPDIILGDYGDSCGQSPAPPNFEAMKTTPINDTDFNFDACLPPQPPQSVFSHRVENGPGNTVDIAPSVRLVPAKGACLRPGEFGDRFDRNVMLNITIPLKNTATPPTAVYGRRIFAGWVAAPDPVLAHRNVSLKRLHLHDDTDFGTPGQLAFWFMNVSAAPFAWLRLSDFTNEMDWFGGYVFDDAERTFTGMNFDFYLRNHPNNYTVASRGYEEDCYDHILWLNGHYLNAGGYIACNINSISDNGDNDVMKNADALLFKDSLDPNLKISGGDQYDMYLSIAEVPLADEDTADLGIGSLVCTPSGEVPLVGQPLTCRVKVTNAGAGIPRRASVTNTFGGSGAEANSGTWTFSFPFTGDVREACTASNADVTCDLATVPAQVGADLVIQATPTAPGLLTEKTVVTTQSNDPVAANNSASTTADVFLPVFVDVEPGDPLNIVEFQRRGLITVAVVSTPDFDAADIEPGTVCFGDADTPAERTCTEVHGRGHLIDVNRDRRPDLVLHFEVTETGIDLGDTRACLKGRTTGNIGVYGCDAVAPRESPR